MLGDGERWKVLHGDCLELMRAMPEASVDSVVTDPPAGISFMGKDWDHHKGGRDEWIAWLTSVMREALRVLKPGGHALVWSIPRTSHWTGMACELAGFEVRDQLYHLFGSGFPKSLNISKAFDDAAGAKREVVAPDPQAAKRNRRTPQFGGPSMREWDPGYDGAEGRMAITAPSTELAKQWSGWGTALKPAAECWWLLRKPLEGTVIANVARHGVGGLNIDGCRIHSGPSIGGNASGASALGQTSGWNAHANRKTEIDRSMAAGRWPANVILDEEAGEALDQMTGVLTSGVPGRRRKQHETTSMAGAVGMLDRDEVGYADSGGASRFFYTAKASRSEKTHGGRVDNGHATVKPVALMRYLVRLVTPPGGLVLDPFTGSGTTGVAALAEGMRFVGCEQDATFVETARQRIVLYDAETSGAEPERPKKKSAAVTKPEKVASEAKPRTLMDLLDGGE